MRSSVPVQSPLTLPTATAAAPTSIMTFFKSIDEAFDRTADRYLFNEKYSIFFQLVASLSTMTILVLGVTSALCYGLLFGTGEFAYSTAESAIISDTESNSLNLAKEIAYTLQQQLVIVAASIAMASVKYSNTLLSESSATSTTLEFEKSYREYNFNVSATDNRLRPSDYGDLYGKTRIPYKANAKYGSLEHTSVYLYSSSAASAARDDTTWSSFTSVDSRINQVINALPYQDRDFELFYKSGPNSTVFFYLSAQLYNAAGTSYYAVHRTYPGLVKNDSTYDPPQRPWFTNAPEDSYYMYGPYKETFTQAYSITLSSKKVSYSVSGRTTNIVSAAVILLESLQDIISGVTYANNGFGALLTYSGLKVLSWKTGTNVYDDSSSSFYSLSTIDAELYAASSSGSALKSYSTMHYTDALGVEWIVATAPFFSTKSVSSSSETDSLILLTFARQADALSTLKTLRSNIDTTTSSSSKQTGIIIGVIAFAMLVLSYLFVVFITKALRRMKGISKEVVKMSTEEEDKKDYSKLLRDAFFTDTRSDEIGALTNAYFNVLCLLHNRNQEKKATPKFPANPFYIEGDAIPTTWRAFFEVICNRYGLPDPSVASSAPPPPVAASVDDSLDVLSSIARKARHKGVAEGEIELKVMNDIEAPALSANKPFLYSKAEYQTVTYHDHKSVTRFGSLKTKLNLLSLILLGGMVTAMIITIIDLNADGTTWMAETSADMLTKQLVNINAIAQVKGTFVDYYFRQLALDMGVLSSYATYLFDGNLTADALTSSHYQRSYALDSANTYAPAAVASASSYTNYTFSGYFDAQYIGCASTADNCKAGIVSNETRLTSLLDLRMMPLINEKSATTFIQIGVAATGFFRTYPYELSSRYTSSPGSCLVQDTWLPSCYSDYYSSQCSSSSYSSYPYYDPRCRTWYRFGVMKNDPGVYFIYPRKSSSGSYVITSVAPIHKVGEKSFTLWGVINSNSEVATLQSAVNALAILDNGYAYIVDSANSTYIVMHPAASSSCAYVKCAESKMSDSEYATFYASVLQPLQQNTLHGSTKSIATSYTKGGETWKLSHESISFGTYRYTVISTVPLSDVLAASIAVNASITSAITGLISAVVLLGTLFILLLFKLTQKVITSVIEPIVELTRLCVLIADDHLNDDIPRSSSSSDMQMLLRAFSNLLVSLRFGSETYARGDVDKAHSMFQDANALFTATKNLKGIGASLNNLGATTMAKGDFVAAKECYDAAIANCEQVLREVCRADSERAHYGHVQSDRQGNLALLHLELGSPTDAFKLLEALLERDKNAGYIRGCVVKQGTLGQYYQKIGEMGSALKMYRSSLAFIRNKDASLHDAHWTSEEEAAAEQIALLNIANFFAASQKREEAEETLVEALCRTSTMHISSVTKTLVALQALLISGADGAGSATAKNRLTQPDYSAREIELIATAFNFKITSPGGKVSSGVKRVAFVVDCSGSMSGVKSRSAQENIQMILDDYISDSDSIAIISFDQSVKHDFALQQKKGQSKYLRDVIVPGLNPRGCTAFYSAIDDALAMLASNQTSHTNNDWIVALTDGDDNSSHITCHALCDKLVSRTAGNVIVLGIGGDVKEEPLRQIASSTPKGLYINAAGDKKSISDAFAQVAKAITGNLLVEDM